MSNSRVEQLIVTAGGGGRMAGCGPKGRKAGDVFLLGIVIPIKKRIQIELSCKRYKRGFCWRTLCLLTYIFVKIKYGNNNLKVQIFIAIFPIFYEMPNR